MSGSMNFPCATCGALLWPDDFERGKAVLIGQMPYCAVCTRPGKPPSTRRGRVPIFSMPSTRRSMGTRTRSRGWLLLLIGALALAAAAAWALFRRGL